MKKKTVEDKFDKWFEREYPDTLFFLDRSPHMFSSYKAGHKSAAIELGKQLREKDKQIEQLKEHLIKLVDACDGYARDAAETEAVLNCFEQIEWEKSDWKFIDIGDTVKFVYGDAGNIWRQK